MGKHKQLSCNICFKPMRSDTITRHMKTHKKYALKEVIGNEKLLKLIDNTGEQAGAELCQNSCPVQ